MTWGELTLGDVIKIKHGWAFKGEHFSDDGEYVLLTPGNVFETGGLKLKGDKERYYTGEFPDDYLLQSGDMIVVMTDLIQNAPILGASLIIPEDNRYLHNQRLGLVQITDPSRIDYKLWFVHLRFPGYEHTPVVDGVPQGWEKRPLEGVCELTMGQSPKSEFYNTNGDGLPFHQGVKDFGTRFVTHNTYCTQPNRIAEPGDILFSVRAPVGRINVASDKLIIGRGLAAIRNKRNCQSFQLYQLKTQFFKEDMIGGGAIFASVTKKQLSRQLLLVPTDKILEDFERIAAPVDQQITNLSTQNQKLAEARDALLPRLLSSKIKV